MDASSTQVIQLIVQPTSIPIRLHSVKCYYVVLISMILPFFSCQFPFQVWMEKLLQTIPLDWLRRRCFIRRPIYLALITKLSALSCANDGNSKNRMKIGRVAGYFLAKTIKYIFVFWNNVALNWKFHALNGDKWEYFARCIIFNKLKYCDGNHLAEPHTLCVFRREFVIHQCCDGIERHCHNNLCVITHYC